MTTEEISEKLWYKLKLISDIKFHISMGQLTDEEPQKTLTKILEMIENKNE
nr:MAG: hypothetical protein [Microviridae sp.]